MCMGPVRFLCTMSHDIVVPHAQQAGPYLHDCCHRECITKMISIPLFVSPVTSCKDMYVHLSCMWTLISHEYIPFRTPFFTLFVVPISSAFIWCRLPEPTPQELLEGRGAQHHRLCGSFESHGQGCEFELPFYRLLEPTKSANYSTSTYVALPVLRAARIPVSTLSHIHVRVWVALLPLSRTNEIGKL